MMKVYIAFFNLLKELSGKGICTRKELLQNNYYNQCYAFVSLQLAKGLCHYNESLFVLHCCELEDLQQEFAMKLICSFDAIMKVFMDIDEDVKENNCNGKMVKYIKVIYCNKVRELVRKYEEKNTGELNKSYTYTISSSDNLHYRNGDVSDETIEDGLVYNRHSTEDTYLSFSHIEEYMDLFRDDARCSFGLLCMACEKKIPEVMELVDLVRRDECLKLSEVYGILLEHFSAVYEEVDVSKYRNHFAETDFRLTNAALSVQIAHWESACRRKILEYGEKQGYFIVCKEEKSRKTAKIIMK